MIEGLAYWANSLIDFVVPVLANTVLPILMATDWSGQSGTYAVYDQGIVSSTDDVPTGDQWLFGESPAPSPTP